MNQDIVTLTQKLITLAEEANSIYDSVRENGVEKDFYHDINPYADLVKQVCEKWEREMKQAMRLVTFKYLVPAQIEQASQNLQEVAIQAFFPKTSYQRFKSNIQSILFTLKHVKAESERLLSQND